MRSGTTWRQGAGVAAVTLLIGAGGAVSGAAQEAPTPVDFGSPQWTVSDGRVVDYLGRKAFTGTGTLKDVEFEDGVIEFDIAASTDRARSYPGVTFRVRPGGMWERFYVRPHRSALYGDVFQYVASFNGVDSWQFYNGPGATAAGVVPAKEWVHVRVEVAGTQARIFLGTAAEPNLVIPHLKHGRSKGLIGLWGPADGTAFFSNLTYRRGTPPGFGAAPPVDAVPGCIGDWQVSKVFDADVVELDKTPEQQGLRDLGWAPLAAEPSGLVDISRLHGRVNQADVVFARATITAAQDEVRKFDLGYSDVVTVFINGTPVFAGDSRYQGRDSSFLGIAGWFDAVHLPLRKGANEITLAVAEVSGGWGFMMREGRAVFTAPGVTRAWELPKSFAVPESAAYDPVRRCLYVSNYDPANPSGADGKQAIAKLTLEGRIVDQRFVTGLKNPTGLVVVGDKLYAVERQAVAEIDLTRGTVTTRYPLVGAGMPNDIAAGPDGALYVSDSARAAIYKVAGGTVTTWVQDRRIARPNGLVVDGGRLVVGTNGDGWLKAIDLATKAITPILPLGAGIIDGLAAPGSGVLLASHNEGRLFRVGADGSVTKILDTTVVGQAIADFALAGDLVVVPTFTDNRVTAYRLK